MKRMCRDMDITLLPVTSSSGLAVGGLSFKDASPEVVGDTIPYADATAMLKPAEGRGTVMVMDVSGMSNIDISEDLLKELHIKRCDTWFMTAVRRVDDLLDAFSTDADMLVMPYHIAESDGMLRESLSLSDSCMPAVVLKGRSAYVRGGRADPGSVLSDIEDIGYRGAVVMDTDGSMDAEAWDAVKDYNILPYSRGKGHVPGFEDSVVDFTPGSRF
jgi:hypothetical protein